MSTTWISESVTGQGYLYDDPGVSYNMDSPYTYNTYGVTTSWTEESEP